MKKRIIVLLFAIFILSILSINVFAACGCASRKTAQTAPQQVQATQPAIQAKVVQEIQPVNISQQTEEKKPDTKTLQKYTGYLYYLFSFLIR